MNPQRELIPTEPFGLVVWLKETRVALPLKGVECRFEATGPLLSVEIDQIFHQDHAEPLDCLYSFPLPSGAAVYRCEMHVNGRVIRARVEEREAARKLYAEQKAAGHRAALVETERENLFTLSLGNLQPGDLVVVRFAYVQVLERIGRELRVRIPVCPGVRYIPGQALLRDLSGRGTSDDTDHVPDASRLSPPRIDALHRDAAYFALSGSIAAVDVDGDTLSSPTHPILVRRVEELVQVELADHGAVPDRDLVVRWEEPRTAKLESHGWGVRHGKETFALLELRAPEQAEAADDFEQDFYFLVDRSGSMEGEKWTQACAALHGFVNLLGVKDRVSITCFESTFQDFAEAPMTAAALKADRGFRQLARLGTAGGTELLPAASHVLETMRRHSKGRRAVVILLTDGQMGNEAEIVSTFTGSPAAAVHTFGIDTTVNDAFLKQLARKTGGECWLLTPDDDVAGTVARLGHRLRRPVLTALGAGKNWEGGSGFIPDLFAGQASHVSLRSSSIRERVDVSAKTSAGKKKAIPLNLAASSNPALRLIWGRDRIAALIDAGDGKAAIALAKEFNLLCEGAAFVAWDEAEKVAIAEREIYQPSAEISFLRCASPAIFLPSSAPRPRTLGSASFCLNSFIESPEVEETRIGEARFPRDRAPRRRLATRLGNLGDFFKFHRPSWVAENAPNELSPLAPTGGFGALWLWIMDVLQRRDAPPDLPELLLDWLEGEFGVEVEAWPVRDAMFVEWVLRGGDRTVDDSTFARHTRELLELRPPAAAGDLRKLRRLLDKWMMDLVRVDADPPII